METPTYLTCKAKAKQTGNRCRRRPVPGLEVCVMHGGKAPRAQAAAAERLAAQALTRDAEAVLAHEGITPIEDPLTELGKLASGAKAFMDQLGKRVNDLNDIEHFDEKRVPQIRVAVELYERAMDRTHRMLDSLVKHGYAERQITIAENEAMLVAGVIRRVVAALGLTPEQQATAQKLLAEEFRQLESRTA